MGHTHLGGQASDQASNEAPKRAQRGCRTHRFEDTDRSVKTETVRVLEGHDTTAALSLADSESTLYILTGFLEGVG